MDSNNFISSSGLTAESSYDAHKKLDNTSYNIGTEGDYSVDNTWNLNDLSWSGTGTDLLCAAFPYLPELNTLVETGQDKTKIIGPQNKFSVGMKLFFKFDGSQNNNTDFIVVRKNTMPSNPTKTRKIKFWFETSDNTIYQFVITFSFNRYRSFLKPKNILGNER